jgi:hypothetical protein
MHNLNEDHPALSMLRLTTDHLRQIKFRCLVRPQVGASHPPTKELVNWGVQAYSFPWLLQFCSLVGGIVALFESNNRAGARILGRSNFELCAHAYYVKKHIKQYLAERNLRAAWEFLLPIGTGSRYINEHHPNDSNLFPSPPHINKAINCFKEVMPTGSEDDYSYLSEYCHPNTMAFQQHYYWTSPSTIEFGDVVAFGALGTIAASALQGLISTDELLGLGEEMEVRGSIRRLLMAIVKNEQEIRSGI